MPFLRLEAWKTIGIRSIFLGQLETAGLRGFKFMEINSNDWFSRGGYIVGFLFFYSFFLLNATIVVGRAIGANGASGRCQKWARQPKMGDR